MPQKYDRDVPEDNLRFCNCAGCGDVLLGMSMRRYDAKRIPKKYRAMKYCAARMCVDNDVKHERPYCTTCVHGVT